MIQPADVDLYDDIFCPSQSSVTKETEQLSSAGTQNGDSHSIVKLSKENKKLADEVAKQKELNRMVSRNFYSLLLTARKEIASKKQQINQLNASLDSMRTKTAIASGCSSVNDILKGRLCSSRPNIVELTFRDQALAAKWLESLLPTTSNSEQMPPNCHSDTDNENAHGNRLARHFSEHGRLKPFNRGPSIDPPYRRRSPATHSSRSAHQKREISQRGRNDTSTNQKHFTNSRSRLINRGLETRKEREKEKID